MLRKYSNRVFAFTETWITNEDDISLWCIDSNYHHCFICDRMSKNHKGRWRNAINTQNFQSKKPKRLSKNEQRLKLFGLSSHYPAKNILHCL